MTLTISNKGWVVIPAELRIKIQSHAGHRGCHCGLWGRTSHCPSDARSHQARPRVVERPSLLNKRLVERARERTQARRRVEWMQTSVDKS
jgi:hypothetical protein